MSKQRIELSSMDKSKCDTLMRILHHLSASEEAVIGLRERTAIEAFYSERIQGGIVQARVAVEEMVRRHCGEGGDETAS